ncbi:hypothetical protein U1Q18_013502 [Sarracenia purpurea var. burkii]
MAEGRERGNEWPGTIGEGMGCSERICKGRKRGVVVLACSREVKRKREKNERRKRRGGVWLDRIEKLHGPLRENTWRSKSTSHECAWCILIGSTEFGPSLKKCSQVSSVIHMDIDIG